MNKLLVVLLAVCLVTVQAAMVRRDAPEAPQDSQLKDLQTQMKEFTKNAGDALGKAFDPKNIQDNFEKTLASMQEAFDGIKKKFDTAQKKPDAVAP